MAKSKTINYFSFKILIIFLFNRQDRANIIPTTRTSTGKLPLPRQLDLPDATVRVTTSKASSSELKEKMEQQLRLQRDAHNKKRAEEMKCEYRTI